MSSNSRSPSLEAMYRKRPSFTRPPIRAINSPRLTDEEADQLTSPFLNYSTGYTYAFSQAYNPDKPPAWEVPNINNNLLHFESAEYAPYNLSAPSIISKIAQKGFNGIWTVLSAVFWLLDLVTLRLLKITGLLLYNIMECILYLSLSVGKYVCASVYNISTQYSYKLRSCSSVLEVLSTIFSTFLHSIFGILRAPVDLTVNGFCKFRRALKRSYYERLIERGREIDRRVMLAKMEEIRRLEVEALRHLKEIEERRIARARGRFIEEYDGGLFNNRDGGYNRYNLRSRFIAADTDSEDDYPRSRRKVSFGLSTGSPHYDGNSHLHKTNRIAAWLGSTASSFVYYLFYAAHLLTASLKSLYDGVFRALSYFTPTMPSSSAAWDSASLLSRAGRHKVAMVSADTYLARRRALSGKKSAGQPESAIVSHFRSLCFSIFYTPSRAFLFVVFAGADLLRYLYSRAVVYFGWLSNVFWNIISVIFSRRHKWLWWLLPFFLLFVFFCRGTNDRMVILGHDVSELQEQVNSYAHSFMDPDAVYAKSLNSIYDEYWRSGKLSRYSILSGITTTARNSYLSVLSMFKTSFGFIPLSVRDLLSTVLDFFSTYGHEAYLLLSRIPYPRFSNTNLSEILDISTPQYFLGESSLASWSSSVGQYLHHSLMQLSNLGALMITGLLDSFSIVWNAVSAWFILIANSFHRPLVDVVDQQTELKHCTNMDSTCDEVNPSVPCLPSHTSSVDETKLINKISAMVRAQMDHDLKIKLEKELKTLSATYDEKLSKLELDKNRFDIDYSYLESIIRTAILEYDSDKTGMFDFALESAGASIISTRCSENYNTYSRLEKIWNIPLWYSSYGPRTVIQRNSKTLFPGECWSFKGSVGYITIGLSHAINVTHISYEHIGAHQAPGGQRPSAPKTFKIWAYKSEDDMNTRVLLGDFVYDLNGNPLQFFIVKEQPDYPVQIIEMEVTSNYGAEYTSLYRLRVHGSLYKPGNV